MPHNLNEIANVIINYVNSGNIDYKNIAPDFPSGGVIINKDELSNIYSTGKGKVVVRAKTEIKNNSILITELPYQVYVEPLLDEIKELYVKDEISGIKDIYNKSDKKRLLIEIECSETASKVLAQLFKMTNLQKSYSANQYALVSKTPKLLNLKQYLDIYITHNIECITKEYEFDLIKAKNRLEIVNGLLKAIEDIDNIIALIKKSESSSQAKIALMAKYDFTENQAKAILDMKLSKLAHLEKVELNEEAKELQNNILHFEEVLKSENNKKSIFIDRLEKIVKKYGSNRKSELTQIATSTKEEKEIEFVEPEKCVVIMTAGGLIKRIPLTSFRTQKRNGKGVKTQDDITSAVIRTNTIDSLMIFTNQGKMYRLLVNDIPSGTNTTKGVPVKSLITMEPNEIPSVMYSIYRDTDAKYVIFITKNGMVKKTTLDEYNKTKKKTGISAINIKENDELAVVSLIKDEDLILLTANGMGIKFNSNDIGATSRNTSGVKGITLNKDDYIVGALPIRNKSDKLAIFTDRGLGKKFSLTELPLQKRAGKGLICYKVSGETGNVAAAALVSDEDSVLVVGNSKSICISATDIPEVGRASIGNSIIKNSNITSVSKV